MSSKARTPSTIIRAAPALAAALAVAIVTPALLLRVSVRVEEVRLGYALSDAAARLSTLRGEHRKLLLELETLRAPDRLARLAATDFDLQPPTSDRIWRVSSDGTVTVADVVPSAPSKKGKRRPVKRKAPAAARGAAAGADLHLDSEIGPDIVP